MLLLVLACLSCVLLAWLRCAFGAAFSSTTAYFAIKPMHAPHRPTILLNCHSDNFVRLASAALTATGASSGCGTAPGPGKKRPRAAGRWYPGAPRLPVWYPPSGKTASLVPRIARSEFPDLGFLRASDTKLPNLAEIEVPNRRSCQL